mmetsp:Transcript_81473/g.143885  ORF Transcript_81473/g.143885 Transcript_81473/m.143885 type:complete len:441 (-) Transcript_81473:176-1498(-)
MSTSESSCESPSWRDGARSLLEFIIDTGTDYMMEYSIQTGFTFVQTACAVASLGGAGAIAARTLLPRSRYVEPLYRRLHAEGGPRLWTHHRVQFTVNPYQELSPKTAVILQGRTREGKTTLLRHAIPWYHRWNVFGMKWLCWQGLYFNGAEASRNDSFDQWVTSQMFGITTASGSELRRSLWEWRQSQWFRLKMEIMRMPTVFLPRPAYVIVDQFEELIKKYPEQALPWADAITMYHTRNNLARVIFVVNSKDGAQSLTNMDGERSRFKTVRLNPLTGKELSSLSAIDREVYSMCENNVGIYTVAQEALRSGSITRREVAALAKRSLHRWELDYHVPFPMHYHPSWLELRLPEAKQRLTAGLEALLLLPHASSKEVSEVDAIMAVVHSCVKRLDARQFFQFTQSQWHIALSNRYLATPGLSEMDAIVVAKHIKRVMGSPT